MKDIETTMRFYFLKVIIVSCFYIFSGSKLYAQSEESLLLTLESTPEVNHDSIYYELTKLVRGSDPVKALGYIKKAYTLALKYEHPKYAENACYGLQFFFSRMGQPDSAFYYNRRGLFFAEQNNSVKRQVVFTNNIALYFKSIQLYDSALNYNLRSLEVARKYSLIKDQLIALNNIGAIYTEVKNYSLAIKYLNQGMDLANREEFNDYRTTSMNNLSLCYIGVGDFGKALILLEELMKICEGANCGNEYMAQLYFNLGYCYLQQDQNIQAAKYLSKAEEKANIVGDEQLQMQNSSVKATLLMREEEYDSAFLILLEIENYAFLNDDKILKRRTFDLLSDYYQVKGQLNKSIDYLRRYVEIKDSIFNETMAKNMSNIQLSANQKESEQIISEKDVELQRSREINILAIAVVLLSISLIMLLIKNSRQSRKAKRNLQNEVTARTRDLQNRNEELAKSHQEYDHLIYRTSHDIRGPLSTLIGLANLAKVEINAGISKESIKNYLTNIENTASGLTSTLSKFLIIDKVRNDNIYQDDIDLPTIITEIKDSFSGIKNFGRVKFNLEIEGKERLFKSDRFLIEIIMSRIIKNAYFFMDEEKPNSFITVKLKFLKDELLVKVVDNGLGIMKNDVHKVFDLFFVAHEKHGSGIGLFLVSTAVRRLKGEVLVESNAEPTIITFKIPELSDYKESKKIDLPFEQKG